MLLSSGFISILPNILKEKHRLHKGKVLRTLFGPERRKWQEAEEN
jgi:hypothetical protein